MKIYLTNTKDVEYWGEKKKKLQKKIHGIRLSEAFAETDKFFETKWQNLNILRQKQNISQEKKRVWIMPFKRKKKKVMIVIILPLQFNYFEKVHKKGSVAGFAYSSILFWSPSPIVSLYLIDKRTE